MALLVRRKMQNHHECHTCVRRYMLEQIDKSFDSPRRCADAHNKKRQAIAPFGLQVLKRCGKGSGGRRLCATYCQSNRKYVPIGSLRK